MRRPRQAAGATPAGSGQPGAAGCARPGGRRPGDRRNHYPQRQVDQEEGSQADAQEPRKIRESHVFPCRPSSLRFLRIFLSNSARGTRRDFRQFVKLAEGRNCELQTQLLIARRLRYASGEKCDVLDGLSDEVGKMLTALSKYLTQEIRAAALTRIEPRPTNT